MHKSGYIDFVNFVPLRTLIQILVALRVVGLSTHLTPVIGMSKNHFVKYQYFQKCIVSKMLFFNILPLLTPGKQNKNNKYSKSIKYK